MFIFRLILEIKLAENDCFSFVLIGSLENLGLVMFLYLKKFGFQRKIPFYLIEIIDFWKNTYNWSFFRFSNQGFITKWKLVTPIIKRSYFEQKELSLFRLKLELEDFSQPLIILEVLKRNDLDFFLQSESLSGVEEQNKNKPKAFSMKPPYSSILGFFFRHHFVKNPFFWRI